MRFFPLSLLFFLALLAGCGSDHESTFVPSPDPPRPNLQYPDSSLRCVLAGIASKNSTLYGYALPDTLTDGATFHAFFDPQDLIDYANTGTTPPTDWTSTDEKGFIAQFFTLVPVSTYNVVVTPDENRADVFGPNDAIYYRHYRVSFGSPPHWLGVGLADLYLRRVGINHDWKLVRWVDRRDTTAIGVRTIGRQRLGPPTVNP